MKINYFIVISIIPLCRTHNNLVKEDEFERNNTTIINGERRQIERPGGPASVPKDVVESYMKKKKPQQRPETFYEPYWENGEWVFDRGSASRAPSAPIFSTSTKDKESHHNDHTSTFGPPKDCDQVCSTIYYDHGPVCAQLLDLQEWVYKYREFKNLCELEYENCRYPTKRWYALHWGECRELSSVKLNPIYPEEMRHNIQELEKDFPS